MSIPVISLETFLALANDNEHIDEYVYFYNTYYRYMFSVAISILHNKYDAEDAVGDTLETLCDVNVFRKIDVYDEGNVKPFIKTIVSNKARDIYRKKKNNNYVEEDIDGIIGENENYASLSAEQLAELNETYEEIKEAIRKMSPTLRDAAHLYLIDGFDYDEISKLLGIEKGTAYTRICRCREYIIKYLKEKNNKDV